MSLAERLKRLEKKVVHAKKRVEVPRDPVEFAKKILNFHPLPYQERLLRDGSKRIAVCMSRQAGKTTTIAVRAIWFASTHPRTLTLIVSPSLRQSMIMMDRVQSFLMAIPRDVRRQLVRKMQRTVIWFRNGSQIVALPNSPNLLRGYTAHMVICDEAAFFRDDELVFYNVLYPMLSTTDGWLIVSSTPWGKDSVFYKMFHSDDFAKHHVSWRDVVEAGLAKRSFIEEMRRIYPPERFAREYEGRFVEDARAYFPQDLISQCIDPDLEYYKFEERAEGNFAVGVDFGKKVDHSAVAVVDEGEGVKRLVHMKRFPLDEPYASVIGYVKTVCGRFARVSKVLCDQTGVGEYIVEDMAAAGIPGVEGVVLTAQRKQEILGYLKQEMLQRKILIPYDAELIAEINVEEFNLTKEGQIKFSHPEGTHDDRLWALALAVYASRGKGEAQAPIEPFTVSF